MAKLTKTTIEELYNVILDENDAFDQSLIIYFKKNKQLTEKQIECLPKKKINE